MKLEDMNIDESKMSKNDIMALRFAKEIEENAGHIFNNAGSNEHEIIDAAIYLTKGAEVMRESVIKKVVECSKGGNYRREHRGVPKKSNAKKIKHFMIIAAVLFTSIRIIDAYTRPHKTASINAEASAFSVSDTATEKYAPSKIDLSQKVTHITQETLPKEKTVKIINEYLGGVLKNKGTLIYNTAACYRSNPVLMTAIMMHETGNGASKLIKAKNNPSGIRTDSGKFESFTSLDEGIIRLAKLLKEQYADEGITDVETIGKTFRPLNDPKDVNSDNKDWVPTVSSLYIEILDKIQN